MSPEQQELAEVTDAQLFESATADEAPAIPEKEAPEPEVKAEPEKPASQDEPKEQPRDESGRFAPKTETAPADKAEPAKDAPADEHGQIPAWRLREEAEARREAVRQYEETKTARDTLAAQNADYQRQLAAMQAANRPPPKQQQVPDPLLDPDGYREHFKNELREGLLAQKRELSLEAARDANPQEFDEAHKAAAQAVAQGDQALLVRMQSSANVGKTLLQWHREQKTMREVGNDPNAWLEKKLEERLKDPAFLAKAIESAKGQATASTAQPNSRPAIDLPPSLSSAARANSSRSSDADDNDVSDEALFRQALR